MNSPETVVVKRKIAIRATCIIVAIVAAVRGYRSVVPWGASTQPWLLARVDGPVIRPPDGRRTLHVYFNDAGAAHSGYHWTWVVEDTPLLGRRVVAQGYLGPDVRRGDRPIPEEWGPEDEMRLQFESGRYAR